MSMLRFLSHRKPCTRPILRIFKGRFGEIVYSGRLRRYARGKNAHIPYPQNSKGRHYTRYSKTFVENCLKFPMRVSNSRHAYFFALLVTEKYLFSLRKAKKNLFLKTIIG